MPVNLYATLTALPGQEATLRRMFVGLAADVRAEPGCLRFVVHTLADDPARFHVEETYADEAAFQTHLAAAHGRAFNRAIETLVVGGASTVVLLDPVA